MKESEFLELLNLYLDHEISAEDAIRLEQELKTNAARRKVYRDYCRMQKACTMLAANFETETTESKAARDTKQEEAFSLPGFLWRWRTGFSLAGAAAVAAALVTAFYVGRPAGVPGPADKMVGGPAVAPGGAPGAMALRTKSDQPPTTTRGLVSVAGRESSGAPRITLVAAPLVLSANNQTGSPLMTTALPASEDELAWVRSFQMISMQERKKIEQLRFETPVPSLRPEGRPLGVRNSADAEVEMTAFRFRK